jgi:hypothetical protein
MTYVRIIIYFLNLFHEIVSVSTISRRIILWLMNKELERIWKLVAEAESDILSRHLAGETEENRKQKQSG